MRDMLRFCPGPGPLAAWLEGALPAAERAGVTAHLSDCDECRRAVSIARGVEPGAPAAVNEGLLDHVVAVARRKPVWRWVAAAVLVAGIAALFSRPRREPPVEPVVAQPAAPRILPVAVVPAPAPAPVAPISVNELPVEAPETPVAVASVPAPPPPEVKKETPVALPEIPAPVAPPAAVRTLAPLVVFDPAGDLWVRRGKAGAARVGPFEKVTPVDSFSSRNAPGAIRVEGRASVVFEKGAEASMGFDAPLQAYHLALEKGAVMIDTEGSAQRWEIHQGAAGVIFSAFKGRLSLEPRPGALAALVIDGQGEFQVGDQKGTVAAGREVLVSDDGKVTSQAADTKKKIRRFEEIRPRSLTAFSATFDDKEGQRPFVYEVRTGLAKADAGGAWLQGADPGEYDPARPSDKRLVRVALKLGRPVTCASDMILRFRYRTTAPSFSVNLGRFSSVYRSRTTGGQWRDAEIPLKAFEHEGVSMVPSDEFPDVRMEAEFDRKAGMLDVDGIYLVRRIK